MLIPDDIIEACGHVFAGEYDVSAYQKVRPVILDIGANVGAFSVWSTYRWPDAIIHAYEPISETYSYLKENTKELKNITTYNAAIGKYDNDARQMYYGEQNRGQSSFSYGDEQRDYGEAVRVVSAKSLPYADIVKVDTEGAELEILENLSFNPEILLAEFHSVADKDKIIDMFSDDFFLISIVFGNVCRGMIKLASKKLA